MADPVSWFLIERGWRVVDRDGEEVGTVEEVTGDQNADIFDGLSVRSGLFADARYVPSEQVDEIVEGTVKLALTRGRGRGAAGVRGAARKPRDLVRAGEHDRPRRRAVRRRERRAATVELVAPAVRPLALLGSAFHPRAAAVRSPRDPQARLVRSLRRHRRRRHPGGAAGGVRHLAHRHRRAAADQEMTSTFLTRGDRAVEGAADKLQGLANDFATQGGVKAKLAEELAEDAAFVRKLKPSLMARAVEGRRAEERAAGRRRGRPVRARSSARGPKRPGRGGPNPFLVVGAALVVGVAVAKVIDWRGHAHPRG